jgi:hypothetical protein
MILERCRDQKSTTLDEFYGELAGGSSHVTREGGAAMLKLIAALRAQHDDRRVWGLTSNYRLCLLAEDTYTSPWYVIVSALDQRNLFVEYLMPRRDAPWDRAYVKGEARSVDEAVHLVLIAMDRCEGWKSRA